MTNNVVIWQINWLGEVRLKFELFSQMDTVPWENATNGESAFVKSTVHARFCLEVCVHQQVHSS